MASLVDRQDFDVFLGILKQCGYTVIGPTVQDQAIVYDEIDTSTDLPRGWTDEQEAGTYRLKKRPDQALFGYVVGPTSWKKFLYPPRTKLWSARRTPAGFEMVADETPVPSYAFLGVRACELHAILIQDKVFLQSGAVDPFYRARRSQALIIAVNCTQAAKTCFCTSMHTGPKAQAGFDLAFTEVLTPDRHYFIVESGTAKGEDILRQLPQQPPQQAELAAAAAAEQQAVDQMHRRLDTTDIKTLLYQNAAHPHWDEVATRCLSCANCTMACPTCFCSTVEDVTDLSGEHAERWRLWDSCFNLDFSYIHGGHIRASGKSRYRQWLTHKLASWQDQFDSSGCVGCGRCITWCPVGIDLTQEVRALRQPPTSGRQDGQRASG